MKKGTLIVVVTKYICSRLLFFMVLSILDFKDFKDVRDVCFFEDNYEQHLLR